MDFASIWVILKLPYSLSYIWPFHIRIYSKFEYNDEIIFQIRISKRPIFFGRSTDDRILKALVMKSILIFVALNVKILRNCPFNKFAKEDVAAVICVDYVEL